MSKISTGYQYTIFQRRLEDLNATRLKHGRAAVGMGEAEAKDTAHLYVYQSAKNQLSSLKDACSKSQDRARKTTSALEAMQQIADRLSTLTSARRSGQYKATYASECGQMLQDLQRALNVRSTNGYVFAGRAANVAPVDYTGMPAADIATADYSYYQGSNSNFSTIINLDGQQQDFEIRADDAGVEKLVRALRVGMTITESVADDDARVSGVYSLAFEECVRKDCPRLQERAGNIEKLFDTVGESIEETLNDLERLIAEALKLDMAGVSGSIQQQQETDLLLKLTYANAQKLLNDSDLFRALGL